MPLHALALESAGGLFVLTWFIVRLALAYANSSRWVASDELRGMKQDALLEAMAVLGMKEAPPPRTRLIVHNGLSACRRRL